MGSNCSNPEKKSSENQINTDHYGVLKKFASGSFREVQYDHIFACNVIGQAHDQDRFACCPALLPGLFYAAVHDGHGPQGADVASRATYALPEAYKAKLMEMSNIEDKDKMPVVLSEEHLKKAMSDVFATFQEECDVDYEETVMERVNEMKREMEESIGEKLDDIPMPADAGTTSTILVLNGDSLLVGWLGDSRAVLARQEEDEGALIAAPLTSDHNVKTLKKTPRSPEMQRIKPLEHEFFGSHLIVPQADGMIQVTRSLGDVPFHRSGVVTHEPDFYYSASVKELHARFLIMASDGLWDHFTDDEAVRFLEEFIGEKPVTEGFLLEAIEAMENKAKELAIAKKAKRDDIVVFVMYFEKKEKAEEASLAEVKAEEVHLAEEKAEEVRLAEEARLAEVTAEEATRLGAGKAAQEEEQAPVEVEKAVAVEEQAPVGAEKTAGETGEKTKAKRKTKNKQKTKK